MTIPALELAPVPASVFEPAALPTPVLGPTPDSLGVAATALLVPLLLGSLVYLDARSRRRRGRERSRGRSLAPLAWGATTVFSGVGCVVVAACYLAVRIR